MPIVGDILTGFYRRVPFITSRLRKKGAQRRRWWHPKLLHGRLYKGYGSGKMVSQDARGRFFVDPEKFRHFVVPRDMLNCELKPYVAASVPIDKVKPLSEWDYIRKMEQTWGPEHEKLFKRFSAMDLGKTSGAMGKFGA